ncbi:uncharacterized protein BDV17DRAFT_264573 [Aspergillus undulatus]|uniref:uncharacterized protein n=1 Tax=Aspergillus undulatus TaxID=1810928 RepID=UPI003CCE45F1
MDDCKVRVCVLLVTAVWTAPLAADQVEAQAVAPGLQVDRSTSARITRYWLLRRFITILPLVAHDRDSRVGPHRLRSP